MLNSVQNPVSLLTIPHLSPPSFPESWEKELRRVTEVAFAQLGLDVYARADYILSDDGVPYFLEINTLPGFTSISMYPKLFAASGIPYSELIDQLLQLAVEAGV